MIRSRRCDYWTTAPYFSLECDEVRDDIREYMREYSKEDQRNWYKANREEILKKRSEKERRLRLQALAVLGGKCVWPGCGITDERLLTIDHRNGDGYIERRAGIKGIAFYKKVLEDPTHYQCLCHNHNWQKRIENGEFRRRKALPSHLPTVNLNEERKAS